MEPAIPHSAESTCLKVHSCIFCPPFPQYKNDAYHVCTIYLQPYPKLTPHQHSRVGIIVHLLQKQYLKFWKYNGLCKADSWDMFELRPLLSQPGLSLFIAAAWLSRSALSALQLPLNSSADELFSCCQHTLPHPDCISILSICEHATYVFQVQTPNIRSLLRLPSSFVPLSHTLTIALIILFCSYSLVYLSPPRQGRPLPPLWFMWVPGTRSVCRYLWGSSMPSTQLDVEHSQVSPRWALTWLSQPWVRGPTGLSV